MPLDLPKAASGSDVQMVFALELYANGEIVGRSRTTSPTTRRFSRWLAKAHAKNTELRAVIKADARVQHGSG